MVKHNENRVPSEAVLTIAMLYQNGRGTPKNIKEAIKWYEGAARDSITAPRACLQLAKIYEQGDDGKPDPIKAYSWLLRAKGWRSHAADAEADAGLTRLAGQMTPKQIKKAEVEAHGPISVPMGKY